MRATMAGGVHLLLQRTMKSFLKLPHASEELFFASPKVKTKQNKNAFFYCIQAQNHNATNNPLLTYCTSILLLEVLEAYHEPKYAW